VINVSNVENFEQDILASLRANRIAPKLLYVSPLQAGLWRQVFLKHSPIHGNPEFSRIYREAFARAAKLMPQGEVHVVGLGCGTGMKEADLCSQLEPNRRTVLFSPIDISRDLVEESAGRLAKAGARVVGHAVLDLAEVDRIAQWIAETRGNAPIVFTFFGMVPNLEPSLVTRLLRAILQPGDVVLVNAHLAPVGENVDLATAMAKVLPQYDNAETLAWLGEALAEWGLTDHLDAPKMKIGEVEGIPALVATARWKSTAAFDEWGRRFTPKAEEPLHLFHSLRYTPEHFEQLLRDAGFNPERLAMTACREEAIWAARC
jgi:L-histidine N-alpha-methyltransferase